MGKGKRKNRGDDGNNGGDKDGADVGVCCDSLCNWCRLPIGNAQVYFVDACG